MTTPQNHPRAFVHFGGPGTVDHIPGGPFNPRLTVAVEARHHPAPISGRTVSGYGRKIPTDSVVLLHNRWRRVYVCTYGNAATLYVAATNSTSDPWLATVTLVDHDS